MKKKELIPMRHLLITRNREVYWYIGDEMNPYKNVICCGTSTDVKDKIWDNDLLADRKGNLSSYEEPRNFDVIYVYEITNANMWFKIFHEIQFIEFEKHIRRNYANVPFVKKVYERIDGELE